MSTATVIQPDTHNGKIQIDAADNQHIVIRGEQINHPILLCKNQSVKWTPKCIIELTLNDFSWLIDQRPEIILVGTGEIVKPLSATLIQQMHELQIGIEFMQTRSAAKTFSLLLCDQRQVGAALFFGQM